MRRMALALAACWGLGMLGGTATGEEKNSLPVTTAVWQPAAQVDGGVTIEPVRYRGRGYYGYYRPYQRPYYGAYRPYYSYRPYYNYYRPYNGYGYGGYYRPYTAGRYYGYPYGRYYW